MVPKKLSLITTGTFAKAGQQETADHSKDRIDLIGSEELINLIVQNRIVFSDEMTYIIDENFFASA